MILARIITPKYGSYQLSTNNALKFLLISPIGGGSLVIIASRVSLIPIPVLAETEIASLVSMPITSSIWFLTRSGSEAGKSILFKIGIIS